MKTIKTIDLVIQAILIVGGCIYVLFKGIEDGSFIYCYYFVGGWQFLSFFSHMLIDKNLFFRKKRSEYGKTNLGLLIAGIISFLVTFWEFPLLLFYLAGLLIVSPVLAIWYFSICLGEVRLLKEKQLVHLK